MFRKLLSFGSVSPHRGRSRKRQRPRGLALRVEQCEELIMLSGIFGPEAGVVGQPIDFQLIEDMEAAAAAQSETAIIRTLVGEQEFAPLEVGLDDPANAINVGGVLYVTGFQDGIGALQTFDLVTGVAGPVQQFHSLNGAGGAVRIGEAVLLDNGQVLFPGSSELGENDQVAAYWIDGVSSPVVADAIVTSDGHLAGAALDGTFVGFNDFGAAVGQVGGTLQALPGIAHVAADITSDAQYIVGNAIWELGENGYQTISTLGFQVPTNGAGLPTLYDGAAIDPVTGDAVFTGAYVDLLTFQTNTGFWNQDGTLLGTFEGIVKDLEVWEGQLVAGLNGHDGDGHLLAITDFSTVSIMEVTGQASTLRENGLFVGSAGFLLDGPSGPMVTAHHTNGGSDPDPDTEFLIDWGDGSPVQTIIGPSGTLVSHTFTQVGEYTIELNGVDVHEVLVTSSGVFIEDGQTVLRVGADSGGSQIHVNDRWARVGKDRLRLDSSIDRIEIFGQKGPDEILVHSDADIQVLAGDGDDLVHVRGSGRKFVDGGNGDDRLFGFGGENVLQGDEGNDFLFARGSTDILIGGLGRDQLFGFGPRTLVITGEANPPLEALDAVFAELSEDDPDADILRDVLDGFIAGDNDRDRVHTLGDTWAYADQQDAVFAWSRWLRWWWRGDKSSFTEL